MCGTYLHQEFVDHLQQAIKQIQQLSERSLLNTANDATCNGKEGKKAICGDARTSSEKQNCRSAITPGGEGGSRIKSFHSSIRSPQTPPFLPTQSPSPALLFFRLNPRRQQPPPSPQPLLPSSSFILFSPFFPSRQPRLLICNGAALRPRNPSCAVGSAYLPHPHEGHSAIPSDGGPKSHRESYGT